MNKLSLFIVLAALIGLSSCSTLRIDKRHYRGGWYVDFGADKKAEGAITKEETEDAVIVENEKQQETKTFPVSNSNDGGTTQQMPSYYNGDVHEVVIPSEETATPVVLETEQQNIPKVTDRREEKKTVPGAAADDQLILLVILAILIPPLAVYMKQGITPMFWITLICWLIGGAFLFGRFGYGYIGGLGLLAIVLALLVVFDKL